jgi:hypothetical protein
MGLCATGKVGRCWTPSASRSFSHHPGSSRPSGPGPERRASRLCRRRWPIAHAVVSGRSRSLELASYLRIDERQVKAGGLTEGESSLAQVARKSSTFMSASAASSSSSDARAHRLVETSPEQTSCRARRRASYSTAGSGSSGEIRSATQFEVPPESSVE